MVLSRLLLICSELYEIHAIIYKIFDLISYIGMCYGVCVCVCATFYVSTILIVNKIHVASIL